MSKYHWGTIYLVRPDWDGDEETADECVVDGYDDTLSQVHIAIELLRLVGDEQHARTIEALLDRVYERRTRAMSVGEMDELLAAIAGLEERLVGTVVDDQWLVRPDQLPDLRRRTKTLNLEESRGDLAIHGVSEGMGAVHSLRNIFLAAKERGLLVAFE